MAAEARQSGAFKPANADAAPVTSGELRSDQTWKKIQQNTFTRWVNQQLRAGGGYITNLEMDLSDGTQLIRLAEVLSGRKMPRYKKNPTLRTQMLDNVSQALKFFQDDEGVKIVNIDSMHIVDHNLKLILGLIYTLIMHYSISKATLGDAANEREAKESPKRRLLAWIKSRLPNGVPVTNFTSDWNDGVALGALVNACVPGSCPEWRSWKPNDALGNTYRAMKIAERNLGIADLITPEELINPNVDEKSVMTYLSQFPPARVQAQGQLSDINASPMIGRETQFAIDLTSTDLRPRVEITNLHGDALPCTIEANTAFATRYDVSYTPKQVGIHKITITAAPARSGSSTPADNAAGAGVGSSDGMKIAETTVNAVPASQLVGLRARTELGDEERFRITNVADGRQLNLVVVGADGREFEVVPSERVGNASVCRYRPDSAGLHSLNVFVDRRHIPGSPFPIRVVNKAIDKVVVWGRGIHSEGTCAGDEMPVHIDACQLPITVSVTTKEGLLVPVIAKFSHLNSTPSAAKESRQKPGHNGKSDLRNRRQTFAYVPRSAGIYHVEVRTADGAHLSKSPYEVKVGPRNLSSVRAIGPGIEAGVKNKKSCFYIDTFGGANSLEFSIEGPNETQIACRDNGDSSAVVDYVPVSSGLYVVNVLNNGEHIRDSPFVLVVDSEDEDDLTNSTNRDDKTDKISTPPSPSSSGSEQESRSNPSCGSPSLSISNRQRQPCVSVVGLNSVNDNFDVKNDENQSYKGFYVGQPVEFIVNNNREGSADRRPLDVLVYGPDLAELPVTCSGERAERVHFVPERPGKHIVSVCLDGVAVHGWPHTVNVKSPLDMTKLRVYGPGVGTGNIFVGQRTSFIVDSQLVGSDRVKVSVNDANGRSLDDVSLHQEAQSCLHTASYTPLIEGPHRINVFVEGEPTFDIKVDVENKRIPPVEEQRITAKDDTRQIDGKDKFVSNGSTRVTSKTVSQLQEKQPEIHWRKEQQPQKQQRLQQPEEHLLHREKDLNEAEMASMHVKTGDSLCDTAIANRNILRESTGRAEVAVPERYYKQQQYLLNGAERAAGELTPKINGIDGTKTPSNISWDPSYVFSQRSTFTPSAVKSEDRKISLTVHREHPIRMVGDFDRIYNKSPSTHTPPESSVAQFNVAEIPRTVIGHNASLYLKHMPAQKSLSGTLPARLSACITAPDGRGSKRVPIERVAVDDYASTPTSVNNNNNAAEQYRVDFFPEVEGIHMISVRDEANKGREIEGSPFRISVSALGIDEAYRVTAHGTGLMTGQVGRLEKFCVTLPSAPPTSGANGGEVSVTVDGPSRAEIMLIREENDDDSRDNGVERRMPINISNENGNSTCCVEYRVDEPGLYNFDIRFNDAPIAGSPFKIKQDAKKVPYDATKKAEPTLNFDGKPHRVTVRGAGLDGFNLGETATFHVDTSNAGIDLLFVGVVTSNEPCDEVFVRYEGSGVYEIDYCIRKVSSKAIIIVKYGDRQIAGSPFIVYPRRTNA